ncbi:hypothetical protein NJ76_02395, partial [Rhodococcus sp. IITR03]
MTDDRIRHAERLLTLAGPDDSVDLAAFLARAARLDEAAVVRLRRRATDCSACGHVPVSRYSPDASSAEPWLRPTPAWPPNRC